MDLLAQLHQGKISLEEAELIFEKTIDKVHCQKEFPEWWTTLELSCYEATAYAQGAGLTGLLQLRYEGWPTTCCRCGKALDYKQFGWWVVDVDEDRIALKHLECPSHTLG